MYTKLTGCSSAEYQFSLIHQVDKAYAFCPLLLLLCQNAANINTDDSDIIKNAPSTIKCALWLRAVHMFSEDDDH